MRISPFSCGRNSDWENVSPSRETLRAGREEQGAALLKLFLPSPAGGGGGQGYGGRGGEVRSSLVQHHFDIGLGLWVSDMLVQF